MTLAPNAVGIRLQSRIPSRPCNHKSDLRVGELMVLNSTTDCSNYRDERRCASEWVWSRVRQLTLDLCAAVGPDGICVWGVKRQEVSCATFVESCETAFRVCGTQTRDVCATPGKAANLSARGVRRAHRETHVQSRSARNLRWGFWWGGFLSGWRYD